MTTAKDVKRALGRIRAALPLEKQVASGYRDIRLGLERIKRVVPAEQSWAGVHVAGTNGKGSICALLSGMFKLSGISHGTFTSPAIPERHNAITINGLYVNKRMYEGELRHVEAAYRRAASGWTFASGEDPGDLTPFELQTAAAFRVFDKMHVKYGIAEVGMGGSTDATNAMREKAVTVISKIDLDHQEYLGSTVEEIAKVKAGIMRRGVPCVVDHSNSSAVMAVLREHAQSVGTQISSSSKALLLLDGLDQAKFQLEDYERQNLLCARLAFFALFPNLDVDINTLLRTRPYPPGRKEVVNVSGLTDGARQEPVLVDAAHNLLGFEALAKHVQAKLRHDGRPVTWVIGLSSSESKPFSKMIETLVRPGDNLAFVEYSPEPSDPPSTPADLGRSVAGELVGRGAHIYDGEPDVASGLRWACGKAGDGPVVVTGSLYLVRELYRLAGVDPQRKVGTRRPGPAQLWHYTQLSQQRRLTDEEAREFKQARRHWHLSPLRNPTFRGVREGGLPQPPRVPEKTRQLQREAAYCKRQGDGYSLAIQSIKRDLAAAADLAAKERRRGSSNDKRRGSSNNGHGLTTLEMMLDELKKRHARHMRGYNKAMFAVRGYIADPEKKHMSHEEMFGTQPKPARRVAALLREFEEEERRQVQQRRREEEHEEEREREREHEAQGASGLGATWLTGGGQRGERAGTAGGHAQRRAR